MFFVLPNKTVTFTLIFLLPMTDAYTYFIESIFLVVLLKTNNKKVQLILLIV